MRITRDSVPQVVNVYIDGYNFYYTISGGSGRDVALLKRAWCDFFVLSERLVAKAFPGGAVGAVKYFTAPVGDYELRAGEAERQGLWLDALQHGARGDIRIIKGFHAKQDGKARVEKQTDINIAISMVRDAIMLPRDSRNATFRGVDPYSACDGVILISGDRDLNPAVRMVEQYGVTPIVMRPGHEITDEDLSMSMLPDVIPLKGDRSVRWDVYMALKTQQANR
jgi:hypothetical protein